MRFMGNFYTAKKQIEAITEKIGFYENVRKIVGFYDCVEWDDYEIKQLQRIADACYEQLGGGVV